MKAEVEITKDDQHFRVVKVEISAVNESEGRRCLREVKLEEDEYVYQICAPCKHCTLSQPFYDFFNGFLLLDATIWN